MTAPTATGIDGIWMRSQIRSWQSVGPVLSECRDRTMGSGGPRLSPSDIGAQTGASDAGRQWRLLPRQGAHSDQFTPATNAIIGRKSRFQTSDIGDSGTEIEVKSPNDALPSRPGRNHAPRSRG